MNLERHILSALLLCGALTLAGGFDNDPPLKKVESHLRAGQRLEAIELLRKLTVSRPEASLVHLRYQDAMQAVGRKRELIDSYRAAAEGNPESAQAQYLYLRLCRGRRAQSELRKLTKKHQGFAPGFVAYADSMRRAGRLKDAFRASSRALELDAKLASAHFAHAWILERQGQAEPAKSHYEQAIRLRHDFLQPRYRLAHLQTHTAPDESFRMLDEAKRIAPDDPRTSIHRAIVFGALGRDKEAVETYKKALRQTPNDPLIFVLLGRSYSELSEWALATQAIESALKIDPKLGDAHAAMGSIRLRLGEYAEADRSFKSAARYEPKVSRHHYFRGVVLERWEKLPEAISAYRRAAAREPTSVTYQLALGAALELHGKPKDAYKVYRSAARRLPDETDLWVRLGHVCAELRKPKKAVAAWEEALRRSPKDPEILLSLGVTYETSLNDPSRAMDCYRRYLAAGGTDARVKDWLSELEDATK